MNKRKVEPSLAQRRAAAEKALGEYQRQAADITSADEIAKILKGESDRGIVITYVSFLEDALVDRVMETMSIPVDARTKLTKGTGTLSNVTAVADLAVCMGIVSPTQVAMLGVMRMMRNACAHCRREINFGTPQLRDAFGLLFAIVDAENEGRALMDVIDAKSTRGLFILMAGGLLDGITGVSQDEGTTTHTRRAVDVVLKLRAALEASPRKPARRPTRSLDRSKW